MCSKYEKITKLGNFLGFFTVINSSISPLGLFTDENDRNDRSPNPSSEMPILVVYLRPEKGTPFKEKLPVQAIIGSTPLPHHPRHAQYFLQARSSKGQNCRSPVLQLNRQDQKCLLLALIPFQNVVACKWRVDLVTYHIITSRICLQLRSLIGLFFNSFFRNNQPLSEIQNASSTAVFTSKLKSFFLV